MVTRANEYGAGGGLLGGDGRGMTADEWNKHYQPGKGHSKAAPDDISPSPGPPSNIDRTDLGRRDALADQLIGAGYDPTKAQELADKMMVNAGTQAEVSVPSVGSATAGHAAVGRMDDPDQIAHKTFQGLIDEGSGIAIGNTDVTTREVGEEELVDNQLNDLLASDSRYIQNARLRGLESANRRGALGSSFSAGAAERSAIEAGLPIAIADAQAYRDVATNNMNALNSFALANLQRATTLDVALLQSNTQIDVANLDASIRVGMANLDAMTRVSIANLDAATQTSIANLNSQTQLAMQTMQSNLALTMQSKNLTHETGMEQLRQDGRVQISLLDGALAMKLKKFELDGKLDMSRLDHEEQLEVNSILNGYDVENVGIMEGYKRESTRNTMATEAMTTYVNYMTAYAGVEMDSNAAKRLKEDAWNLMVSNYELLNLMYPELAPLIPKR